MASKALPLDAIAVCGPSGVGKGTLLGRLMKTFPDRFGYSVSHTTRAPREGEQHGREYFFVDRPTVEELQKSNAFIEVCEVHGNLYGTTLNSVKAVRETGKVCIIEVDVNGAQKIREKGEMLNVLYLFITAPSMEHLRGRIQKRGADNEEVLQCRLRTAEAELRFLEEYPDFFSRTFVNDDLETTYADLVRVLNEEFETRNMDKLTD
ncbi:Guanylate kinase/L-type calcium channel beta subunit [Trypanosoma melophagium]|uniref:Guanylate kinase/L-type calcium channel beta subunit n=1 Tax=Trypanosoma melophagium TaxID=715481 RepID=UPI00351A6880|nr:Guanylate kinase/L-type calcium channel beta subunit [Trypanosoma melophagium]